jgi:protein translocase SecG subunit
MFYLLLVLLILDALLLSVVVLLQAGQGGGLASLGGGNTDTVLGGRQAVTILTKATWWCGGIFLALSLVLQFVPRGGAGSALQERLRAATPAAPVELPGTSPVAPAAGADSAAPAAEQPAAGQPPAPKSATPQTGTGPQPGTAPQAQPKSRLRRHLRPSPSSDPVQATRGEPMTARPAFVLLEDSTWFPGTVPRPIEPAFGEVVFTTNITGYQETFTDPSYLGQIVVMTAPMIGNYGINAEDMESERRK